MTPKDSLYLLVVGLALGAGFAGIIAGLIATWRGKPKRNCDVGTPEEQYSRFEDYHAEHGNFDAYDICESCHLNKEYDCRIAWMNMPYKKKEEE